MSEKGSKKNKQILALLFAALVAAFLFVPIGGRTGWQRVSGELPDAWKKSNKTPPAGRYQRPPTAAPAYQYRDPAVGSGGPTRGSNAAPVHDISAREQSDLDRLIDRKLKP